MKIQEDGKLGLGRATLTELRGGQSWHVSRRAADMHEFRTLYHVTEGTRLLLLEASISSVFWHLADRVIQGAKSL